MKCKSAPVYVPFMTTVIGADSVELNFLKDSVTSYTQLYLPRCWKSASGKLKEAKRLTAGLVLMREPEKMRW